MPFIDETGVEELSSQIHTLCNAEYATATAMSTAQDDIYNLQLQVGEWQDELPTLFWAKNYQYNRSFPANTTTQVTGTQLGVSTPEGYTPMFINRIQIGTAGLVIAGLHPNVVGSSSVIEVRNTTSSAITQTVNLFIVYIKTDFIKTS